MDPTTDNMNCGSCGFACAGELACTVAALVYTVCGCTNMNQCGAGATGCSTFAQCECSGQTCSGNEVCVNNACSCPNKPGGGDCGSSDACCSDGCKNLGQDPNNCGACGHKCGGANPHCVGAQCQ